MSYNQNLPMDNTAEIRENFRALKEDEIVAANTANTAEKLKTARTINGVSFDGSTDITITQMNGKDIATVDQIPNDVSALQSEIAESTGYGILSGLQVTAKSTPNMTVQVSAGTVHMPSGQRYSLSTVSSQAITAADSTKQRIDLIYVSSTGIVTYLAGTPASSPIAPKLPSGAVSLANISVAANQTAIITSNIMDNRIFKANIAKNYKNLTFGTYENAVAASFTANSGVAQTPQNTQVNGTTAQGIAVNDLDTDHVGVYISAGSFVPTVLDNTTTYTATTCTNAAINSTNSVPGMFVKTLHSPVYYVSTILSVSGNTITVDGWYAKTTGEASTPTPGIGAIINPNSKIFGSNIVVGATGNGTTTGASKFTGTEYDLATTGNGSSPVTGTCGIDMVTTAGNVDVMYQARGKRNITFFSNNAGGNGAYGLKSIGDARGISVNDATSQAIEVINGGVSKFNIDPYGNSSQSGIANYTELLSNGVHNNTKSLNISSTAVDITLADPSIGGLYWIAGYNTTGGAEYQALISVRAGNVAKIFEVNNTGLTITFTTGNGSSVRRTYMSASGIGTLQVVVWSVFS